MSKREVWVVELLEDGTWTPHYVDDSCCSEEGGKEALALVEENWGGQQFRAVKYVPAEEKAE